MKELRVVLVTDGPRLDSDILRTAIERAAGLTLVAVLGDVIAMDAGLAQHNADCLIACHTRITRSSDALICLLQSHPGLRIAVFSLTGDGIHMLRYARKGEDLTGKSWAHLMRLLRDGSP